jgi:hypothetical protein
MNMSPPILADFAAPAEGAVVKGDVVRRRAPLIFEAGRYDFVGAPTYHMTPAEIRAACEAFEPVPVVDTHVPSHFNRKMTGTRLVKLTPNADFTAFGGELELDRWFDDLFKGEPLTCSATWDRQTKRLKNVALVPNPRIPGAVIEAAFAAEEERRHHTPHGQEAMQDIHDRAARAGARCNPDAAFTADHDGDALQEMHDTAVKHGAVCRTYPAPEPKKKPTEPEEAPMSTPAPELEARFEAQRKDLDALKADTEALKRDNEALKKANAALQTDNRAAHKRRIEAEAAAFAREQHRLGIISRAERDDTEAEFAEAALEDLDAPKEVTFADAEGKPAKGGRVDRLRARYARRPADPMRRERVADRDGDEALFSRDRPAGPDDDDGEMSEEEYERLLAGTERGRQILRERAAQNAGANAANGRK